MYQLKLVITSRCFVERLQQLHTGVRHKYKAKFVIWRVDSHSTWSISFNDITFCAKKVLFSIMVYDIK